GGDGRGVGGPLHVPVGRRRGGAGELRHRRHLPPRHRLLHARAVPGRAAGDRRGRHHGDRHQLQPGLELHDLDELLHRAGGARHAHDRRRGTPGGDPRWRESAETRRRGPSLARRPRRRGGARRALAHAHRLPPRRAARGFHHRRRPGSVAGVNRDRFPGLSDGWARFDAPAGSQPVDTAIEAISEFMRSGAVANHGGAFEAAERTDALVDEARKVAGEFLGGEPRGVVFGPSMTSLTICFSAAIGRTLEPGDEIVCTRLDHDGNVAPWLIAAKRADVTVRFAEPDPETLDLPAGAVEAVLSDKTRWVAVTAASNAVGAVPDLEGIVKVAHQAGARVYIDAVHA